jgi:hypothetical protein
MHKVMRNYWIGVALMVGNTLLLALNVYRHNWWAVAVNGATAIGVALGMKWLIETAHFVGYGDGLDWAKDTLRETMNAATRSTLR